MASVRKSPSWHVNSQPLRPAFTSQFQALSPEAAKESKSTLIPFLLEGVGGIESLNQPDGIHPTAEGQAKVAENVWKVLQPVIAQ